MSIAHAPYTDSFAHSFDDKGRITVPSEWRQESLYEKILLILPSTREKCLRVYPASWMSRRQARLEENEIPFTDPARLALEELATSGQTVIFDSQGRMMVKPRLREKVGLKRDVMLVGRSDHFQIWDEAVWNKKASGGKKAEEIF